MVGRGGGAPRKHGICGRVQIPNFTSAHVPNPPTMQVTGPPSVAADQVALCAGVRRLRRLMGEDQQASPV